MDALDRTFRHLVHTIRARYPAYLTQPFEVAELYQNILPYRHHRRELGLDTNQDYEQVLLQLLSGAREYLIVDEQVREVLARALALPGPDTGAFREFSTTRVTLSATAVAQLAQSASGEPEPAAAIAVVTESAARTSARGSAQRITAQRAAAAAQMAPPARTSTTAQAAPRPSAATVPVETRAQTESRPIGEHRAPLENRVAAGIVPQAGEACRYCSAALPAGRRITFCPHCGQNLTVVNCLACGTELELGWKYCTTCGRPAAAP